MKLIVYILLLVVNAVHGINTFSYPHREYAGVASKLYATAITDKVSNLQELISSVDRTKMKDAEFNSVIARVLCRIYFSTDPILDKKFEKELLKTKFAEYAVTAAKFGSTRGLSIISEVTTGYAAICCRAMILMLTGRLKDCVMIKQQMLKESVNDTNAVLTQIFGKTVCIPDDYPEDDHGRIHMSPVSLDFSIENISKLESMLKESNGYLKDELLSVLQEWKTRLDAHK